MTPHASPCPCARAPAPPRAPGVDRRARHRGLPSPARTRAARPAGRGARAEPRRLRLPGHRRALHRQLRAARRRQLPLRDRPVRAAGRERVRGDERHHQLREPNQPAATPRTSSPPTATSTTTRTCRSSSVGNRAVVQGEVIGLLGAHGQRDRPAAALRDPDRRRQRQPDQSLPHARRLGLLGARPAGPASLQEPLRAVRESSASASWKLSRSIRASRTGRSSCRRPRGSRLVVACRSWS